MEIRNFRCGLLKYRFAYPIKTDLSGPWYSLPEDNYLVSYHFLFYLNEITRNQMEGASNSPNIVPVESKSVKMLPFWISSK